MEAISLLLMFRFAASERHRFAFHIPFAKVLHHLLNGLSCWCTKVTLTKIIGVLLNDCRTRTNERTHGNTHTQTHWCEGKNSVTDLEWATPRWRCYGWWPNVQSSNVWACVCNRCVSTVIDFFARFSSRSWYEFQETNQRTEDAFNITHGLLLRGWWWLVTHFNHKTVATTWLQLKQVT